MLISDILRSKGSAVVTVPPDATVERLIALLAEHRIGAVVVSADGDNVDGIVSERDVVRVLAADGTEALATPVSQICTDEVTTAEPSQRLEWLMGAMTEGRFRHVPVLIDGKLAGVVSIGDVVKARIGELEDERQALTGYITSGG
jgi:CBS domain-containing protein